MTVADCVRSHIAWITASAVEGGGEVGREGTVDWAWVPGESTVHLLFPEDPGEAEVADVAHRADAVGARSSALWAADDPARDWLEDLGFEQGWQPWWMTAAPADVPGAGRDRVRLVEAPRAHDPGRDALIERDDVLLAEATEEGRYAGRAWLHLDDDVAGIYDMNVWPRFQRRGLGRELLGLLAAEAHRRGARILTLNATPDGAGLYSVCGFTRVGEGRTWWRHA